MLRISTQNIYTNSVFTIQQTTADIAKLNQQLATGKELLQPSDDPIGSVLVMASERDVAETNQFIENISALKTGLNRQETHLSSLVDLQHRMREITTSANNGSLSAEDRAAYASELEELLASFVDSVNAKDEGGNFLFSGNETSTVPISTDASGYYVYQGNDGHREVQTSSSSWMTVNVTADEFLFSNPSIDILNQTQAFIDTLNDPTLSPGEPAFDSVSGGMLNSLDDSLTSISQAITVMGGKQNSLSLQETAHSERVLFNEQVIGESEGLDYAKAMSEFNVKLTALQVTQQTFVQVSQLSLFDHMR
ncbi:flagellar hook-associated protein FlgL [Shewanella sp. 202IG2-18]|uniref:flagellar hook-associated protein FlgL n=1 Tax=Parashewanella hymeniacidonis TaxID=2807618 RepID=UPI001961DF0B|nr:flagellar hook-associated protein FlgL [Parashewanella hymeniacidonis]MBM7072853.1 flagellar hook-associated protein FlgL [Parashewanella hymeniacidonis]